MKKIDVAIVGASGYTGLELVKILLHHPHFSLKSVATTEGDTTLDVLHPSLLGVSKLEVTAVDVAKIAQECALVFLAVPHKTAMELVPQFLERDIKVVDLSADYRLNLSNYEANYCLHSDSKNLSNAVYGLPELYRDSIAKARLIANPGCYPTASLLGILPFIDAISTHTPVIIDAKSGVSGAGKKATSTTHFVSIHDNMHAYSPLQHRHAIEIQEKLTFAGLDNEVIFVPHLTPITRGMLASIYVQLANEIDPVAVLRAYYANAPFVRIRTTPPTMKEVAGTNFCDIYVQQKGKTLFIATAIDNLMRGASSQAVVNANIMFGLPQESGIPVMAYLP
ncbi:MAG: N-acetyl-gamma-glutamyl-phosphate reductase [Sulfuricurvum sp. PC08-66]|nr:MAG: N-acetyl-gamma-glutamyl-phosphate reductase [Sulfuricurvum sp. PC08-66]